MTYKIKVLMPATKACYEAIKDSERWGIVYCRLEMNHNEAWYDLEFKSQGHYNLFMLANSV